MYVLSLSSLTNVTICSIWIIRGKVSSEVKYSDTVASIWGVISVSQRFTEFGFVYCFGVTILRECFIFGISLGYCRKIIPLRFMRRDLKYVRAIWCVK